MGTDRYYRMEHGMWSKSSKRFADRMASNVLKLGLGLGSALLSRNSSSARTSRGQQVSAFESYLRYPTNSTIEMSAKSARVVCIILLILSPSFQVLGYVAYVYWKFWTFFSLLIFSTLALLCIGFSFTIAGDAKELSKNGRNVFYIATIIVAFFTLCLSFWPLIIEDSERTFLSYVLLVIEDILLVGLTYAFFEESSVMRKKTISGLMNAKIEGTQPAHRRTSRTVRIKEMEARYDGVKAALAEVIKAEEKLSSLSDDIEALREYLGSGKWQKDFEADEQGKLPKDLKRGVLSEDGLWDLLEEVDERIHNHPL